MSLCNNIGYGTVQYSGRLLYGEVGLFCLIDLIIGTYIQLHTHTLISALFELGSVS